MTEAGNLAVYSEPDVVSFYEKLTGLQPCEQHLFDRYLRPGMSILDMGVGGGRTTPYLSGIAGRYVGADYSAAMVEACRKAWPRLEFRHCDATNLSEFADGTFDAAVFAFNGIDYISSDEARGRCLREMARVLKPGGVFILSSHNARQLGVLPIFAGARGPQRVWRVIRSLFKSLAIGSRTLGRGVFFSGEGYLLDPVHGGLLTYASSPETMTPQLAGAGFEVMETVGGHFPEVSALYFTPWHYYAARRAR